MAYRILVVDDDRSIIKMIKDFCSAGFLYYFFVCCAKYSRSCERNHLARIYRCR